MLVHYIAAEISQHNQISLQFSRRVLLKQVEWRAALHHTAYSLMPEPSNGGCMMLEHNKHSKELDYLPTSHSP